MNRILNDVRMDTQTAYFVNGDINIYPACYEHPEPMTDRELPSAHHRNGRREHPHPALSSWLPRTALQGALQHRALRPATVEQRPHSGMLEILAQIEHPRDLPHPQTRNPHGHRLFDFIEIM